MRDVYREWDKGYRHTRIKSTLCETLSHTPARVNLHEDAEVPHTTAPIAEHPTFSPGACSLPGQLRHPGQRHHQA